MWMLFPTEEEYIEWFTKAGFQDVKVGCSRVSLAQQFVSQPGVVLYVPVFEGNQGSICRIAAKPMHGGTHGTHAWRNPCMGKSCLLLCLFCTTSNTFGYACLCIECFTLSTVIPAAAMLPLGCGRHSRASDCQPGRDPCMLLNLCLLLKVQAVWLLQYSEPFPIAGWELTVAQLLP